MLRVQVENKILESRFKKDIKLAWTGTSRKLPARSSKEDLT
jgi:hypothetical protein